MPRFWETNLIPASFAGVQFPVGERQVSGGRSFARHRPTFTGGQRSQDTGRDPYVVAYSIPLFRGVSTAHYPETYERVRAAVDDPETKGLAELVDPELGAFLAKVVSWKWKTDPALRDGGIFEIVFEEESDESSPIPEVSWRDPVTTSTLTARADLADADLEEAGVTDAAAASTLSTAGVPLASTPEVGGTCRSIVSTVVSRVQDVRSTIDNVQAQVEYAAAQCATLAQLATDTTADSAQAWGSLQDLAESIRRFGESALQRGVPLVAFEVPPLGLSAYELAASQYGDLDRVEEILGRVVCAHPLFLPIGSVARIAVR